MSGPVRRIILRGAALTWATRLDLQAWVERQAWDAKPRYLVINRARESYTAMGQLGLADDPHTLIETCYLYFQHDEEFNQYVVGEMKQDITDDETWDTVYRTYAQVILQKYNREIGGQDD